MYKNILIILGLLLLSSCSQPKPTPKVKEKIKKEIKAEDKNNTKEEVVEEFIPEHLKHSKIEVVKHY